LIYLFIDFQYRNPIFLCIPISAMIAIYFSGLQKPGKLEVLLWLIFIISLISNYQLFDI
jgi:hypothetical protein